MRAIAIVVFLAGCGGKRDEPPPQAAPEPTYPIPPRVPDPPAAAAPDDDPPPTPHERQQQEIVDALNTLIVSFNVGDATVTSDEEDLMIMTPPHHCDLKVLRDLRKGLAALDLDPAKAFSTMQCNGGPMLKLKK